MTSAPSRMPTLSPGARSLVKQRLVVSNQEDEAEVDGHHCQGEGDGNAPAGRGEEVEGARTSAGGYPRQTLDVTSSPVASSVWSLLDGSARQYSNRPAILAPGREPLTYLDLAAHVARTARHLRHRGFHTRSRLAVVLPNGPEMATAFAALASCGVCAPLNPAFTRADFEFYLPDLRADALARRRDGQWPRCGRRVRLWHPGVAHPPGREGRRLHLRRRHAGSWRTRDVVAGRRRHGAAPSYVRDDVKAEAGAALLRESDGVGSTHRRRPWRCRRKTAA